MNITVNTDEGYTVTMKYHHRSGGYEVAVTKKEIFEEDKARGIMMDIIDTKSDKRQVSKAFPGLF